ncbi:MAG: elongation factor G [Rhodospirillaceae bacterium]|nr:elongation factor G [Rhodospirillaceae bacterium]
MPNSSAQIVHPALPRAVALVGPQSSGKTSLLESLLFVTGAIGRKGLVKDSNTFADASEEARARQMSTELSVAHTTFLDEHWTFLDCPGSIELEQEAINPLMAVDAAIVVCEPDLARAVSLSPMLRMLDEYSIPHLVFINKMDTGDTKTRDLIEALQGISSRPLVLREVPIREGDQITGYVDLVSERAYHYTQGQPSKLIQIPDTIREREQEARQVLLESLADFDDALLEQLLEDTQPPADEVYRQLTKDLADDLIVPVMFGSAERDQGVRRLLKALRHEVPTVDVTAARRGAPDDPVAAQVFKTVHALHTGKLSYARVWRGRITDGMTFGDAKVSGIFHVNGGSVTKATEATEGQLVALGRMDTVATGDVLAGNGHAKAEDWPEPLTPVFSIAVAPENRGDEVKMTGALQRLMEEDPSISFRHDPDTGELQLHGRGEIHLQIAIDRMRRKANVAVTTRPAQVPYKETIRSGTKQHTRFKRQTGGHGQFADVHIEVSSVERGTGFQFNEKIVGGAIPRNFIPAVEAGVRDYLKRGPLGFPVVDVAVTLYDGQFHTVDSSDMAFRTCGRQAMQEAMPKCGPVLLEPILQVVIAVPNEFTPKVQRVLSSRRGQILGFDARPGWTGWDEVKAYVPQAEMHDLIVELRSLSLGLASYTCTFDHLQELSGRLADKVIEMRQETAAAQ